MSYQNLKWNINPFLQALPGIHFLVYYILDYTLFKAIVASLGQVSTLWRSEQSNWAQVSISEHFWKPPSKFSNSDRLEYSANRSPK